jgi:hypothetical protein
MEEGATVYQDGQEMSIKTAIFAELAGNSNVTNVVSTRVWLNQAKQNETLPYVVFHRLDNTPEYHMGAQSGLTRGLFQIDCYDDDPDDAHDLSEVIREALSGQRGTIGSGSHTAVMRRMAMLSSIDFFEEPIAAGHKGIFSEKQTWEFWHTMSVP